MLVSVFTPSHDPRFLDDCYRSLEAQTNEHWEWVVLLNRGARQWHPPVPDDRVRVNRGHAVQGVGSAKHGACELAAGEILVELDHDDIVAPTCLADVHDAFAGNRDLALVYSDFAQVNADLSRNDDRFNQGHGVGVHGRGDRRSQLSALPCAHAVPPQRGIHLVRPQSRTGLPDERLQSRRGLQPPTRRARRPRAHDPPVPRGCIPSRRPVPVLPANPPRQHAGRAGHQPIHPAADGPLLPRQHRGPHGRLGTSPREGGDHGADTDVPSLRRCRPRGDHRDRSHRPRDSHSQMGKWDSSRRPSFPAHPRPGRLLQQSATAS